MSAHLLDGDHLACVPGIVITGALRILETVPTLEGVTCAGCLEATAAPVPAPAPAPCVPTACPFCRLLPHERRRPDHTAKSKHTLPIEIRALPGATFRTTKRDFAAGSEGRYREARPTWKAPTDVGRAFRRALLAIVEIPESVEAP